MRPMSLCGEGLKAWAKSRFNVGGVCNDLGFVFKLFVK